MDFKNKGDFPFIPGSGDKNKAPITGDMSYDKNLTPFTQTEQYKKTGGKMVMGKFSKKA